MKSNLRQSIKCFVTFVTFVKYHQICFHILFSFRQKFCLLRRYLLNKKINLNTNSEKKVD